MLNSNTAHNIEYSGIRNREKEEVVQFGAHFIELINKHFPLGSKLYIVKISYSCMTNMQQIIKSHKSELMNINNNNHTKPLRHERYRNETELFFKYIWE